MPSTSSSTSCQRGRPDGVANERSGWLDNEHSIDLKSVDLVAPVANGINVDAILARFQASVPVAAFISCGVRDGESREFGDGKIILLCDGKRFLRGSRSGPREGSRVWAGKGFSAAQDAGKTDAG